MSIELIPPGSNVDAIRLVKISRADLDQSLAVLEPHERLWVKQMRFQAKPGEVCLIPDENGHVARVLFGAPKNEHDHNVSAYASLASALPGGTYQFSQTPGNETMAGLMLLLEDYDFTRYRTIQEVEERRFVISDPFALEEALRLAKAVYLTRDLINTPTNDLGPAQLSEAVQALCKHYQADFEEIVAEELLAKNFPLIHAVGRASAQAPRLLDFRWGLPDAPKITLVGKGVCFDSGGLNIKTGNFMTLMKKDMGGAANVLGLAQLIMDAKLPVRLRVLIPAVENAISGNAFRPGDVLASREGMSVEISNTDAEGRLVLADALCYGDEEAPEMMIDMATLTGAARVALGPDIAPFYSDNDMFAEELMVRAKNMADPVWRMPLWPPYQSGLDSLVADVNHASSDGFAGSVTAALFLSRFVKNANIWAHFDIYAWTPSKRPGRQKGGEAQAIRAVYALLKARYAP